MTTPTSFEAMKRMKIGADIKLPDGRVGILNKEHGVFTIEEVKVGDVAFPAINVSTEEDFKREFKVRKRRPDYMPEDYDPDDYYYEGGFRRKRTKRRTQRKKRTVKRLRTRKQ